MIHGELVPVQRLAIKVPHHFGLFDKLLAEDRRLRDFFKQNRLLMLPLEEEVVFLHQVHGADVFDASVGGEPETAPRADALVTDNPEQLLLVRTADCVPVLLCSSDGRRVAAVHAGWKGLLAGVLPAAVVGKLQFVHRVIRAAAR